MIISGANSYPSTLNVPGGGQPATAGELDQIASDLADRTTFLLAHTVAALQHVRYECLDGDNIVISPIFGLISFDTMPRYMQTASEATIGAADIEGGIAPIGSSFYYIYMYWSGGPKFELSLAEPDAYRIYKSTGTDRVLVGVAQTEATAKFSFVRGLGREIRYLVPPKVRNLAPASPTVETISLAARLPPIAEVCCLSVNGITTASIGPAFEPYVSVGPAEFDPSRFRKLLLPTGIIYARATADIEVPLGHRPLVLPDPGNDRKISLLTDSTTSEIELYLNGYKF
jgi:hypothetical protein